MVTNSFCEIYLIRHGETDWNKQGILQGQTDISLNEEGEKQAQKLGKKLEHIDFSAIISTDLMRGSRTAEIVRGKRTTPIELTPALRERCMKRWETCKRVDYEAHLSTRGRPFVGLTTKELLSYEFIDGIETFEQIYQRFYTLVQSHVVANIGKAILMSSHGGVLKSALFTLDSRVEDLRKEKPFWAVPNCSCLRLRAYADGRIELVEAMGPEPVAKVSCP